MSSIEKLKNIEILRFIFSLSIICVHLKGKILRPFISEIPIYQNFIDNFKYASIPVDFFFIIAGFFLFLTTNFSQNFTDFAIKKLKRLMPVVFYIITLYWIFSLFTPIKFIKYENVFSLLNISVGITTRYGNNHCTWFVSALFLGMCFYFYLYKSIDKKIFNIICACLVFLSYSLWVHTNSNNDVNIYGIFNVGLTRAFAGLGVGYFLSNLYKENITAIKKFSLNIPWKIITTAAEIFLFGFILKYTCLHKMNYDNPMILVVAFIGLFILFVCKKGYFSKLLDNNLSVFLGQFSYSIFMTHFLIKDLWAAIFCPHNHNWIVAHPYANLFCLFLVIILFGMFTYYAFEKPVAKFLKNFSFLEFIKAKN